MGIDFTSALGVRGLNFNTALPFRSSNVNLEPQLSEDRFESNSPNRFTNETILNKLISNNPKISAILKETPASLNMKELEVLLNNHCADVQNIARGITDNLPFSLKNKVDTKSLDEACYLHDIGKVLIPAGILNKNGKLNPEETKIMHKHSELGYEILKNTNINPKTLHLIRNHHQNAQKNGYPLVGKDFRADLDLQILTMADKYSALTEKRVYKDSIAPKQALTIIYTDVKEGKLHPFVFKALVNYVNSAKQEQVLTDVVVAQNKTSNL